MMNATISRSRIVWISGTTQYALRAVLFVAEHGTDEPVRVDAIAAALNVPRNYLSKTLHSLARAGVLRSGRGPRGGFQLAAPAAEISLARVAAQFDDLGARNCLLGRTTCGWKNPCSVHPRWEAVSNALQAFFRETTIADLLGEIADRPSMAPKNDRSSLAAVATAVATKRKARAAPRRRSS
jgi:Rrf2 family protein